MPDVVQTCLLPCSPERAFAALSDLDQLVRWWGPHGFTSTSDTIDFRPGGGWTMTLHGPDGTAYPNFYRFVTIEPPFLAVIEHPDPAHHFVSTYTFEEAPGGTHLTWRQHFDSEAHFAEIRAMVEAANPQLLERLTAVVTAP